MKRRSFVKQTVAASLMLSGLPVSLRTNEVEYSTDELTGRGSIQLFGEDFKLREEPYKAFLKMKKAAYQAGFDAKVVSGYRSFDRQRGIWERKFHRYTEIDGLKPIAALNKIIEYSTIPGTSRHHWGTEIDIIDANPKVNGDVLVAKKFDDEGPFFAFKKWLDLNAEKFGFYLVYTDNYFRKGFKYEPWHYSYAHLSIPMLKQFRKKNILKLLSQERFEGSQHFNRNFLRNYIHNHILDINPALL